MSGIKNFAIFPSLPGFLNTQDEIFHVVNFDDEPDNIEDVEQDELEENVDLNKQAIFDALMDATNDPTRIIENEKFDPLFQGIKYAFGGKIQKHPGHLTHSMKRNTKFRSDTVDSIIIALRKVIDDSSFTKEDSNDEDSVGTCTYRNAIKMYFFLLVKFLRCFLVYNKRDKAEREARNSGPSGKRKKRKKKKKRKKDEDVDMDDVDIEIVREYPWMDEILKIALELLGKLTELKFLWQGPIEFDFLYLFQELFASFMCEYDLINRSGNIESTFKMFEDYLKFLYDQNKLVELSNPSDKYDEIEVDMFVSDLLKYDMYGNSLLKLIKFMSLKIDAKLDDLEEMLKGNIDNPLDDEERKQNDDDEKAEVIVEDVKDLSNAEYDRLVRHNGFMNGILVCISNLELEKTSLYRTEELRRLSSFLCQLALQNPELIIKNIVMLKVHTDSENYAVRNVIISLVAELLKDKTSLLHTEKKHRKLRNDIFDMLLARLKDVSSRTRKKVIVHWIDLIRNRCIPTYRFNDVCEAVAEHMEDMGAIVRRHAVAFLIESLQFNGFGGSLKMSKFSIDYLKASHELKDYELENRIDVSERVKEDDDVEDMDKPKGELSNDEQERLDRVNNVEYKKLRKVFNYHHNATRYINLIHRTLQDINVLLNSRTVTDIKECIRFVVIAKRYHIEVALNAFRCTLRLIYSKDEGIKDSVIDCAHEIFFAKEVNGPEECLENTKKFLQFLSECYISELQSFKKIFAEMLKRKMIKKPFLLAFWEVFMNKRNEFSSKLRKMALVAIDFVACFRPMNVIKRIDMLLKFGLYYQNKQKIQDKEESENDKEESENDKEESENEKESEEVVDEMDVEPDKEVKMDVLICIFTLRVLRNESLMKTTKEEGKDFKLKNNNVLFKAILIILLRFKLYNSWIPLALEALGVIFNLAENPTYLVENVISLLTRRLHEYNKISDSDKIDGETMTFNSIIGKLIFMQGEFAMKRLAMIDEQHQSERTTLKEELDKDMLSAESDMREEELEDKFVQLKKEIVKDKLGLFPIILKIVVDKGSLFGNGTMRFICINTLCKFMIVSKVICTNYLKLIFTLLLKTGKEDNIEKELEGENSKEEEEGKKKEEKSKENEERKEDEDVQMKEGDKKKEEEDNDLELDNESSESDDEEEGENESTKVKQDNDITMQDKPSNQQTNEQQAEKEQELPEGIILPVNQTGHNPISDEIRGNIVVFIGDLHCTWTNEVDVWTKKLYGILKRREADVKLKSHVLVILNYLILSSMIKTDHHVSEIAKLVVSTDKSLASRAKYLFVELSKRGKTTNPIYNIFLDLFSNLCHDTQITHVEFQEIFRFVLSFIKQENQIKRLVDKLSKRFKDLELTENVKKSWVYLIEVVDMFKLSVKSFEKVVDNYECYKMALVNVRVFEVLMAMGERIERMLRAPSAANNANTQTMVLKIKEWKEKVMDHHKKLTGAVDVEIEANGKGGKKEGDKGNNQNDDENKMVDEGEGEGEIKKTPSKRKRKRKKDEDVEMIDSEKNDNQNEDSDNNDEEEQEGSGETEKEKNKDVDMDDDSSDGIEIVEEFVESRRSSRRRSSRRRSSRKLREEVISIPEKKRKKKKKSPPPPKRRRSRRGRSKKEDKMIDEGEESNSDDSEDSDNEEMELDEED